MIMVMNDVVQLVAVTLVAGAALALLVRPYVRKSSHAGPKDGAGAPGCGTCDHSKKPTGV
jgi:hypothetical protein